MADYIDRQCAIDAVSADGFEHFGHHADSKLLEVVLETLAQIPTADVATVVHGHWKLSELSYTQGAYVCSECNKIAAESVAGVKPLPTEMFGRQIYQYCPYCGAKMDKEVADATD